MDRKDEKKYTRRQFGKIGMGLGASVLMSPFAGVVLSASPTGSVHAAEKFPERNIDIYIPSGTGGQLEFIARAHSDVWSQYLNTACSFNFNNAASGEVQYTMFTKKRPDGYSLLFGNIEPFVAMYVTQNPKFDYRDLFWACTLAVDPAVIITNKKSRFKSIQDVIESKSQVTMAVAHWASMDAMAAQQLAKETGANFNIIPYGGGKKARLGIVQEEVDCYLTKIGNAQNIQSYIRYLAIVQDENEFPEITGNCPTLSRVIGKEFPEIQSLRNWVFLKSFVDTYPDRYKILMDAFKKAYDSGEFKEKLKNYGVPPELMTRLRDDRWTEKKLLQSMKFAQENKDLLKKKKK